MQRPINHTLKQRNCSARTSYGDGRTKPTGRATLQDRHASLKPTLEGRHMQHIQQGLPKQRTPGQSGSILILPARMNPTSETSATLLDCHPIQRLNPKIVLATHQWNWAECKQFSHRHAFTNPPASCLLPPPLSVPCSPLLYSARC